MAGLLRDRHLRLGGFRTLEEGRFSEKVRAAGVRTPAVVAAAAYPLGAFYRGDVITEIVPDSSTLAACLLLARDPAEWEPLLGSAEELVTALASAKRR